MMNKIKMKKIVYHKIEVAYNGLAILPGQKPLPSVKE